LWGATAIIAFIAQVHEKVGFSAIATLALGVSPCVIFVIAVIKKNYDARLNPWTIGCTVSAVVGIVLWRLTDNANIAICFSIITDISASVPTLIKAYERPTSEDGIAYFISMLSLLVVLLTIKEWRFVDFAFPLYMLLINATLLFFSKVSIKERLHRLKSRDAVESRHELAYEPE
jgi:steroid 5-alpha reductase family enzyme